MQNASAQRTHDAPLRAVSLPPLQVVRSESAGPRFPGCLRVLDAVHRADRGVSAIAADTVVLLLAGLVAGAGLPTLTLAALAAGFLYMARCYLNRSSLETQGVLWYPSAFAGPYALAMLALVAVAPRVGAERGEVVGFALVGAVGLFGARALTWAVLVIARHRGSGLAPTLVVGDGPVARTIAQKLADHPGAGLHPVGIMSPTGQELGEGAGFAARPNDLPSVVRRHRVEQLVIAPEGNHDAGVVECLEQCDGLDVQVAMLPPLADLFLKPSHVAQVAGLPLLPLGRICRGQQVASLPGKRLFDLVVSSLLLALFSPLLLVVAAAVKLSDGGPVLFRQRRVGLHGSTFEMLKFRSMVVGADRMILDLRDRNVTDGLLFKVEGDPRVTRVGELIRRFSIDELPQLWNVLRGEMSLVGPRPLACEPNQFGPLDGMRHVAVPGITGYWQLSGGNGLTYQEMIKLDMAYIQSWSLWLDVRLLLRTIPALLYRRSPY